MEDYQVIYEQYDDFDTANAVAAKTEIAAALNNKKDGQDKLESAKTFVSNLARKSELSGKPEANIMADLIDANPIFRQQLRSYVSEFGMVPADATVDLIAQVAFARNEHIAEVQEMFSGDNFDGDSFDEFTSRKSARKARREAKFNRRAKRREMRAKVQEARLQKRLDKQLAASREYNQPLPEPEAQDVEFEMSEVQDPSANVSFANSLQNQDMQSLIDPTPEEAEAIIIGEEMNGFEDYCGPDSYDCFLPILAGAISAGGKVIDSAKEQGADFSTFKSLFGKKKQAAKTAGQTKVGSFISGVQKSAKDAIDRIEQQKKSEYLRRNAPWIVLGAVALVFIGYKVAKK
jgi:hypothetical protein